MELLTATQDEIVTIKEALTKVVDLCIQKAYLASQGEHPDSLNEQFNYLRDANSIARIIKTLHSP